VSTPAKERDPRRGEKLGWAGGFFGSSLWIAVLGVLMLYWGEVVPGLIAFGLYVISLVLLYLLLPWRNPERPMALLLAGTMAPIFGAIGLTVFYFFVYTDPTEQGLQPWSFLWITMFVPLFFRFGKRRWSDGERG